MSDPVHWQDAKVTDRLVEMVFRECEGWLESKGILSASGKLEEHLRGAIAHAGEALDGYVMAYFLESRRWPSDEVLVLHLAKAKRFREEILVEFNPPDIMTLPFPLPLGTKFKTETSDYIIVGLRNIDGDNAWYSLFKEQDHQIYLMDHFTAWKLGENFEFPSPS